MKKLASLMTRLMFTSLLTGSLAAGTVQAQESLNINQITENEFSGSWQSGAEELAFHSHAKNPMQTEMTLSINGQQFAANFDAAAGRLEFPEGHYAFSQHQQDLMFDVQAALSAYLKRQNNEADPHVVVLIGTLNHFAL